MPRNATPQTFLKRQRERDRQEKRQTKDALRKEKSAARRAERLESGGGGQLFGNLAARGDRPSRLP